MQNIGAAALFLPVVSRISTRTGIPLSRLVMPMGFCAILGGTLTLIGSSPLILLNDLIETCDASLPAGVDPMETFNLFSVTPVGLALVATGIYALIVALATSNSFVLPTHKVNALTMGAGGYSTADFMRTGGIMTILFLVVMLTVVNAVF